MVSLDYSTATYSYAYVAAGALGRPGQAAFVFAQGDARLGHG